MGCGCQGGSGDRTGSTRTLGVTKRPGYTWDGDDTVEDAPPVEDDLQADDGAGDDN